MAFTTFCSRTTFSISASFSLFRVPLLPAFGLLTLAPNYLDPSVIHGKRFPLSHPLLRSNFISPLTAKGVHSTAMEGNTSSTVACIVVYVTVPNKEAGKKLAESIIKEKLGACVNRVPGIESIYHWEGQVQTDSEELLIIKTRESLLEALTEHVKAYHEYDVPEVIAMPIIGGNLKYLEWIKNSTRD